MSIKHNWFRLEARSFYGTEPNENRWNIDWGGINSYSATSILPSKNWMAQISAGRITKPERQAEGDVVRTTASVHYTRPAANGNDWSSSLDVGRNHDTATQHDLSSYLLESIPLTKKDFLPAGLKS